MEVASFRGVEFEFQAVEDGLERRVAEHLVPYANGAQLEDLGRAPRPTSFTAVFYGEDYLARLGALLTVLDEGVTGPLVHPLYGTWQAKYVSGRLSASHDQRDVISIQLEFREDGLNQALNDLFSFDAAAAELDEDIADLQADYSALGRTVAAVESAIADAQAFADDVSDAVDDARSRVDQLQRYVLDAVRAVDDLDAAIDDTWRTVTSLRTVVHGAKRVSEQAQRRSPTITNREIETPIPLPLLALKLYGSVDRVVDLLRLNAIENPFLVPPGTKLRTHAR